VNLGERVPFLLLVLWTVLFILLSAVFVSPQVWAVLGVTSLLEGTTDWESVWQAILRLSVIVFTLGAGLLAVRHFLFPGIGFSKFEYLLWSWAPAVGVWIFVKRCVWGAQADWVAVIEPLLITWVLPLGLVGLGRAIGASLGGLHISQELVGSRQSFYPIICSLLGATSAAFLLFLLSLVGLWNVWTLWAPVLIASAFGCRWICRDLPGLKSKDTAGSARIESWATLFPILLILTAVVELSFLPPDESDELRYHLSIPKQYLEAGGRVEIPDRSFSRFPLGMETLFALPTSLDWLRAPENRLGLVSGAKFIHAWFFILCLMTVYLAGRELSKDGYAPWGPLIFATLGFGPTLATWAFVDFGAAFGWLASILFTWVYFRSPYESAGRAKAMVWLAAVALGWSLMVKYTSLAWWFILVLFWIIVSIVRKEFPPRTLCALVFVPLLLVGPWSFLNAIETGNPFYPLLSSVFGSGFDAVQKGFYDWHAGLKGDLIRFWDLSLPQKLFDLLLLPFKAALFPWQFENNPIGGLIPCLLPAFLYGLWKRRGERLGIAFVTVSLFLLWALTYRDPRFAIPLWGVYAVVAGVGLSMMVRSNERTGAIVTLRYLLIAFLLLLGLGQSDEIFRRYGKYRDWNSWSKPPDEYLANRLPFHHTVREVEELRRDEPVKPTLLLLGMEQSYYFDSPLRGADYFDAPWLAGLAREASEMEEITRNIRDQGIDWIFINRDTLESNDANVARGALFCLDPAQDEEEIETALKNNLTDIPQTPAFRRMHAWLIRHPGYAEVSLRTEPPGRLPVSNYYRAWMDWPELKGMSMEELPRRRYSLLAPIGEGR
jgi:hypothetical protein